MIDVTHVLQNDSRLSEENLLDQEYRFKSGQGTNVQSLRDGVRVSYDGVSFNKHTSLPIFFESDKLRYN